MTEPVEVHVVLLDGDQLRAGLLRFHHGRRAESAACAYDEAYLADPRAYERAPDSAHAAAPRRARIVSRQRSRIAFNSPSWRPLPTAARAACVTCSTMGPGSPAR